MISLKKLLPYFLIALIASFLFIPFIGNCPLFDWDEVNFAECAREMVVSGDYSQVQINYRPFWEKPPFFIWCQAICMQITGVNEFSARLPNAICGVLTLLLLFHSGRKFHSPQFGGVWAALYASCMLPHLYFRSGLIDPWFNLFMFSSLYHLIPLINNPAGKMAWRHALVAGIFLGLAVLTKGPAAFLIVALTLVCFAALSRQPQWFYSWKTGLFFLASLTTAGAWFLSEWMSGHGQVIREFVNYQVRLFRTGDAGHEGPVYYHFMVLLAGCFPASMIFILSCLKKEGLTPYQLLWRRMMLCLFWCVLLLFSVVKTKIVHYSSLCYFPLTFIAAAGLVIFRERLRVGSLFKIVYWLFAGAIGIAFLSTGLLNEVKEYIRNHDLIDEFGKQNLAAQVSTNGFEFLTGLIFLAGVFFLYFYLKNGKLSWLRGALVSLIFFNWLAIMWIIPLIEQITQDAAIRFYKWCSTKSCYVETHRFKSYAYLFYSKRQPGDYQNPDQKSYIEHQLDRMENEGHSRLSGYPTANLLWMEHGRIDRPAYIVAKTPDEDEVMAKPGFILMYRENGFSFFVRYPEKSAGESTATKSKPAR
jgi:4-amino-4-deoxy-L-arabinose transferase-like glycosyltransferase